MILITIINKVCWINILHIIFVNEQKTKLLTLRVDMKKLTLMALAMLSIAYADTEQDKQAILATAGCWMVDYNYHEVEKIDDEYAYSQEHSLDPREYHAKLNKNYLRFIEGLVKHDKSIDPETYQLTPKEKIFVRKNDEKGIHLQHVFFLTNSAGELAFVIKHHSEYWRPASDKAYDYCGQNTWNPICPEQGENLWTRELNALDDSPRYSCTAPWDHSQQYSSWTCSSYSPIPGREYRDMDRKDYQGLNRTHELTIYDHAWLDTQNNEKVRENEAGVRQALVREKGRNWYTRLENSQCEVLDLFLTEARLAFWDLTQSVWEQLLSEGSVITEDPSKGPRWSAINGGPSIMYPNTMMGKVGSRFAGGKTVIDYPNGYLVTHGDSIKEAFLKNYEDDPEQAIATAREAIYEAIREYSK